MNKVIAKLSLIIFLSAYISCSINGQGFALNVNSVQQFEIDTIKGDTIFSDVLYGPCDIQVALDSLNSPYRVVLPDSIDKDFLKTTLASIVLNKTRIDNGLLVTDAIKLDFMNLGLPDIVYDYFLQEIADYNFGNRLRQMSSKDIEEDFKRVQERVKEALHKKDLFNQQRELLTKNKPLFETLRRIESADKLTPNEVATFLPVSKLLSEKLELVDGILSINIPQQISENSLGWQYIKYILDYTNLDFEINNYSLENREDIKNDIKDRMQKICDYLQNYKSDH